MTTEIPVSSLSILLLLTVYFLRREEVLDASLVHQVELGVP